MMLRSNPLSCLLPLAASALVLAACGSDNPRSQIEAGKAALEQRDNKTAVVHFKSALQRDPGLAEARLLLGRALLEGGDPASAVLELEKARDAKAPDVDVLPLLARALLLNGDYPKLISQLGSVVLPDKTAQATLMASLATAYGAMGNRAKTEESIAAALQAAPDFGPAQVLNARLIAGRRDFDAALAAVDKVLAKDPRNAEAWVLKGDILGVGKSDADSAAKAYEGALQADASHLPAHIALVMQRLRAQDVPGAQARFAKMRELMPNHPMTLLVAAQLAFISKDLDKARDLTAQLMRGAPSHPSVLMLAGSVEGQAGSLFAAETHFTKLLTIDPESTMARRSLALVYMRLGQPAKAAAVLKPLLDKGTGGAEALALAGDAALRLGDAAQAERLYQAAARMAPDDERLRTALALSQLRRGDATGAFESLQQIAGRSKDTFAEQAIVSARLRRAEFEQALQAVDAMDRKKPDSAEVAELRGRVLLLRGDRVGARAAFDRALKLDPRMFAAVSALAGLDVADKKPDEARRRLEAAVAADPRNHLAVLALAELRARGDASLDEMRKLFGDAIKAAPQDPAPRLQYISWLLSKRLHKEALVASQEAVAAMPNDATLLDAVGRAQMEAGDIEQAVTTFRRLAGSDGSPARAYVRLADVFRSTGRRQQAEAALRKAIELEPTLQEAHVGLIALLVATNRAKDALEHTQRRQRDNPDDPNGYAAEASFHLAVKAPDAALDAYRRGVARTRNPELARWLHGLLVRQGKGAEADRFAQSWRSANPGDAGFDYHLATVHIGRSEFKPAEALLRPIVERFPENSAALNNLAWVLAIQGRPEALEFARRALQRAPDSPQLLDTMALALSVNNDHERALATQQRAVELLPNAPALRLQLAQLAIRAGNKPLARSELERLKAMGPSYKGQAQVEQLLGTL